jgi:hypothetical protein
LFAFQAVGFTVRNAGNELELRASGKAEPFHLEDDALLRFLGDPHHAANERLLCAPQMQQRRVPVGAYLVLRPVQPREPLAVLAHLGQTRGAKAIERPPQFARQLHEGELSASRPERQSHFS